MSESPAVTLRRAAEKARGLANAASTAPWRLREDEFDLDVVGTQGWVAHTGGQSPGGHADAAYIAAMHPGVGLLLADQWDAIADHMDAEGALAYFAEDGRHTGWSTPSTGKCIPIWTAAFTAARTFLGEN